MNMCGTLGPYGSAVTSSRPSRRAELPGEPGIEQVADRQSDAEGGQHAAEHDVLGQLHHAEAKPGQHDDVQRDVGEQTEEAIPVAGDPP